MNLEPGLLITRKLRLERKIAEGGMGTVWLAEHLALERKVALKFLSPALLGHREARARFEREARAVARLKSPYVPEIFDVGETEDGTPFIALEPLKGQDLYARLIGQGPLSPEHTATVVTHVCSALREAHAQGIIHRDVKPENIFLVPDDDGGFIAKLLDFGIAKAPTLSAERLTQSATPIGTPNYMSPEQLLCEGEVDARADLWSLGVVAYECLTGRLPFDGQTFAATCAAIAAGRFVPPSAVCDVSPAVDPWFDRAFRRDPAERFEDAAEMSRELRFAVGRGEEAFPLRRAAVRPPYVGPTQAPRSRPRVAGWMALAVVGLAGTVALGHSSVPWAPVRTLEGHATLDPAIEAPPSVDRLPLATAAPVSLTPAAAGSAATSAGSGPAPISHRARPPRPAPRCNRLPASFNVGIVVDDEVFDAPPVSSECPPSDDASEDQPENPY